MQESRLESALLQSGPETAHILFMDMVGYSRLHSHDQRTSQDELVRTVRATEDFREARVNGQLISRSTGDGMALLFFGGALAAVRCAVQITEALRGHQFIRLRMGINTGPVLRVQDINSNSDIAGEGIVVAQRVMDLGDAGHILISGSYKRELDRTSDIRYPMGSLFVADLGKATVKHGLTVPVFSIRDRQFGTLKFGNPIVPKKMRPDDPILLTAPPPPPLVSFAAKAAKMAIAGILFVVFLFFVSLAFREARNYGLIGGGPDTPTPVRSAGASPAGGPASPNSPGVSTQQFVGLIWGRAHPLSSRLGVKLIVDNAITSPSPDQNDTIAGLSPAETKQWAYPGDSIKVIVKQHPRKPRSSARVSSPRRRVKRTADGAASGGADTSSQGSGENTNTPPDDGGGVPQPPSETGAGPDTTPENKKGDGAPSPGISAPSPPVNTGGDAGGSETKPPAPDAKPTPSQSSPDTGKGE